MRSLDGAGIILAMTRPAPSSRVLLIADRRPIAADPRGVSVRRYRLARLRLDGRSSEQSSRFEHLKRTFD